MTLHRISSSAELTQLLRNASSDMTIELAPGDYGKLTLDGAALAALSSNFHVDIKSADPSDPAVVRGLAVSNATNLTFDGITFDYTAQAGANVSMRPFTISNSDGCTIKHSIFEGDLAQGVSSTADGYGSGIALGVRGVSDLKLVGNDVFDFHKAFVIEGADRAEVRGNEITRMSSDGINFANAQDVLIEKNHIHNFLADVKTTAHMDMIQFWTRGQPAASQDVVIRGNYLDSGLGKYTQTILIKSEQGPATEFKNFLIEDNFIHNSHVHGITINQMDGISIQNNTVISNPDTALDPSPTYVPRINIGGQVKNATLTDNVVNKITGAGYAESGTMVVQNSDPTQANYYGTVFVDGLSGGKSTPVDWQPQSGELIAGTGAGADLTYWIAGETDAADPDLPLAEHPEEPPVMEENPDTGDLPEVVGAPREEDPVPEARPDPTDGLSAVNDAFSIVSETHGVFDVLANDISATPGSLSITNAFATSGGALRITADNQISYMSGKGFSGTETILYEISDGNGGMDAGLLEVEVKMPEPQQEVLEISTVSCEPRFSYDVEFRSLSQDKDNVLYFNDVEDYVRGLEGDDHIRTTNGNDVIFGGEGNDTLRAGNGDDDVFGGAGNDHIFGGRGRDIISGGAGRDTLKGNYKDAAGDVFVFTKEDIGDRDTILDFDGNEGDLIDLSAVFCGLVADQSGLMERMSLSTDETGTTLSIQHDGTGSTDMIELVLLKGVDQLRLEQMIEDQWIILA